MNHDERFQQRWEFRSREADEDTSSDDNGSNASGEQAERKHKLVTNLLLLENDEESDAPKCERHDTSNGVHCQTVKAEEKKIKSSKKKKVAQNKSEGRGVKEVKRKRRPNTYDMVMFRDLKIFADSLVHDLTVARENMFEHMREEMRKLVASRSNLEPTKKNVKRSQKKKARPQNEIEARVKPQNYSGGSVCRIVESYVPSDAHKFPKGVAEATKDEPPPTNELHEGDRLRLSAMFHMKAYGSDQLVSSSQFPLPTVLPKPQLQNQRSRIHTYDHIPSAVPMNNSSFEIEIGKLMAAKTFSDRFAEFQQGKGFGSFSHSRLKGVGLLGQSSSQTTIQGIGYTIPLNQCSDNGCNMSSLTHCENSFMDNNVLGPRMNGSIARFPGRSPASPGGIFPNAIISKIPHKTNGEHK